MVSKVAAAGNVDVLLRRLTVTLTVGASLGLVLGLLGRLETLATPATPVRDALLALKNLNLELLIGDALFAISGVAILAVCVRTFKQPSGRYWLVLTALFGAASLAKITGSVARFEDRLRVLDSDPAWNGWQMSSLVIVTAQAILAVALGLFFVKWILSLEPLVRRRILAGGVVFLAGAVGMEAVTEWLWSVAGPTSLSYLVADWLENGAEAAGLIVFLDGLLVQLASGSARRWQTT
jgi:hypothetical protein